MTKNKPLQLTKEGLEELEKELKDRSEVKRKQLQDELDNELREGDITENTSYYRVQEEIGSNEKRIEELQDILNNAQIVDEKTPSGKKGSIKIGSTVTIKVGNKDVKYEVVGSTEADPTKNKISVDSPLGKALVGKTVGEEATVKTPLGNQKYAIIAIE